MYESVDTKPPTLITSFTRRFFRYTNILYIVFVYTGHHVLFVKHQNTAVITSETLSDCLNIKLININSTEMTYKKSVFSSQQNSVSITQPNGNARRGTHRCLS